MTTDSAKTLLSEAAITEKSAAAGEPQWLLSRRLEAWRAFEGMAMPDPLEEEWRRTDLSALNVESILSRQGVNGVSPETGVAPPEAEGPVLRQKDGVDAGLSGAEGLRPGVVFSGLQAAASTSAQLIEPHLHRAVPAAEWKLQALEAAAWSGGVLLYVPRNVEVEVPLRLISSLSGPFLGLHILVVAEENSGVTLVHETQGESGAEDALVTGAVEIICGPNARVRFLEMQRWGGNTFNFSTLRAHLERGAQFSCALVGLGSKLSKTKLEVALEGEASRAEIIGLTYGDESRHIDYATLQDHTGPRTSSDLLFKSALTDRSSAVWNGTVHVHKGSSQSEASQTSRNLLLSKQAKAAPIPVLEIEAYDVLRCSHAATAGPVDEEQMFYLESRGIPAPEAERLLVEAFFNEVVDRIPVAAFREQVTSELEARIGRGDNGLR